MVFEQNEDRLGELRDQLDERAASLGELFGVVRQVARDTAGLLENSLVSAQLGERAAFLYAVGESRELPSLDELERLWVGLLEEMTQSGRVVQFPTTVVDANGNQAERTVVRVGVFNSVSQGNYLRYVPETRQLVELTRQPEQRYRSDAQGAGAGQRWLWRVRHRPVSGSDSGRAGPDPRRVGTPAAGRFYRLHHHRHWFRGPGPGRGAGGLPVARGAAH